MKSTLILLVGFASGQVIRFGGSLITTRMLAPELFGAMAIANTIATIVLLFSDLGFGLSIIRSERGEEPVFLKTIFTFKALQAALLGFFIYLITLIVWGLNHLAVFPGDSAFANKDLPVALCIIAFATILRGLRSIQIDLNVRKQQVGKQIIIEVASQVFSLVFIIGFAKIDPSIYALAFSNVVGAVSTVGLSYLLFDRSLFGFAWDKSAVKEILSFGKWIQLSTMIVALSNNLDKFIFGYLLTSSQLGVYSIASLIFTAMGGVFDKMNTSLFPAISAVIREQPKNVSNVYYKIRLYRDLIISFPTSLVITNGDLLVSFIYDERYHQAGYYLQLMSIAHLINCFLYKANVITAYGNSKIQFQTAVWRFMGIFLMVPLGYYFFDVTGVILAFALRRLLGVWLLYRIFINLGLINWLKELRTLAIIGLCLLFGILVRVLLVAIIS